MFGHPVRHLTVNLVLNCFSFQMVIVFVSCHAGEVNGGGTGHKFPWNGSRARKNILRHNNIVLSFDLAKHSHLKSSQ